MKDSSCLVCTLFILIDVEDLVIAEGPGKVFDALKKDTVARVGNVFFSADLEDVAEEDKVVGLFKVLEGAVVGVAPLDGLIKGNIMSRVRATVEWLTFDRRDDTNHLAFDLLGNDPLAVEFAMIRLNLEVEFVIWWSISRAKAQADGC